MHSVHTPSAVSIDCYWVSKIRSYGGRGSFFWFSWLSLSLSYTKPQANSSDPTDTKAMGAGDTAIGLGSR